MLLISKIVCILSLSNIAQSIGWAYYDENFTVKKPREVKLKLGPADESYSYEYYDYYYDNINKLKGRKNKPVQVLTTTTTSPDYPVKAEENTKSDSESNSIENITEQTLQCEESYSLLNKNDLIFMINRLTNNMEVYKLINNSYYSDATFCREFYKENIEQFMHWFKDRPQHLKHIVETIAVKREVIGPKIAKIKVALEEYPELKHQYLERKEKLSKLEANLNTEKKICDLTCKYDTRHVLKISKVFNPKNAYCGSIHKIYGYITDKLQTFVNESSKNLTDRIIVDKAKYGELVENLKNKLKDIALKDFGRPMYDLLTLEDEHYHFNKNVQDFDVHKMHSLLRQHLAQVSPELLKLENSIVNFGKYCRSCMDRQYSIGHNLLRSSNYIAEIGEKTDNGNVPENLLDKLINLKLQEIHDHINNDYQDIFKQLNEKLEENNMDQLYLFNLKDIQEEIKKIISSEKIAWDILKGSVSMPDIDKMTELVYKTDILLSTISNNINYINEYVN